ncbi:MAG TPA: hypothetical protein VGM39_01010 [Kofleriaceae bacterium]
MAETPPAIVLAERVATEARELGIETALIGAVALAAHNYVRATNDADLASSVDPFTKLSQLERRLSQLGLRTRLITPDDEDPLGGVLKVWEREDADEEPVESVDVVNFLNPYRPRRTPGEAAIRNALPFAPDSILRYARLADLIALKLYGGGRRGEADVVDLLVRNPNADLDEVRAVAKSFGLDMIDELVDEALAINRGRK